MSTGVLQPEAKTAPAKAERPAAGQEKNAADNGFITGHIPLVHSIAARFKGRGIEYDELFSAGCVGLVKAGNNFDSSRGLCFSTYAVPVIMGEIKQLFRDGGQVKVGRTLRERAMKLLRIREEMEKNGETPSVALLAQKSGMTAEEAALAIGSALPAVSLSCETDDGCKVTDIPVEPPQGELIERLALRQSLSRLSAEDRRLLWLRYSEEYTQSRTAELLGMTQVQVSRKERRLLERLREELM